jgi:hypothetical protein
MKPERAGAKPQSHVPLAGRGFFFGAKAQSKAGDARKALR